MTLWQYLAIAGFGAFHGLNPGMGWLVALAAGVRDRSRAAVLRALVPIGGGHALSVFAAAFLVTVLSSLVTTRIVAIAGGAGLLAVAVWRALARHRSPDAAFQPSSAHLLGWSFLMSSVHGAGLALLPVLVATPTVVAGHVHGVVAAGGVSLWSGPIATAVHTLAMVAVTGVIALAALRLARLPVLRWENWFQLDLVWTVALVGSGAFTIALAVIG